MRNLRFSDVITVRVPSVLVRTLEQRADAAGHGNVSLEARLVLIRALKIKVPVIRRRRSA